MPAVRKESSETETVTERRGIDRQIDRQINKKGIKKEKERRKREVMNNVAAIFH